MALAALTVVWWSVQASGHAYPPRAHARLVTEKGLAERPLCGLPHAWGEEQPTKGRCRRCEDIIEGKRRGR